MRNGIPCAPRPVLILRLVKRVLLALILAAFPRRPCCFSLVEVQPSLFFSACSPSSWEDTTSLDNSNVTNVNAMAEQSWFRHGVFVYPSRVWTDIKNVIIYRKRPMNLNFKGLWKGTLHYNFVSFIRFMAYNVRARGKNIFFLGSKDWNGGSLEELS